KVIRQAAQLAEQVAAPFQKPAGACGELFGQDHALRRSRAGSQLMERSVQEHGLFRALHDTPFETPRGTLGGVLSVQGGTGTWIRDLSQALDLFQLLP